jgi:hypothetical protein
VVLATDVALPAGTNAIGKLAANSGVDIGDVDVTSISPGTNYIGKVRLTDGTTDTDIRDLANSNALNVAIVDASGDQITSFGGGTQYTEDAAAAANPIGNALIVVREDGRAGSLTTTDGDNVALRGNNFGELYVKHTDSIAVTNGGTFATQVDGAALTSLQLIDDTVFTDDTSTHSTGVTKGLGVMAVANPTDAAVDANDIGMVAMTLARALKSDITTIAGTAPTTAGFIDIKGADGNVFVRQATASNLNMTEASAASILTKVTAGAASMVKAEDVASANADSGAAVMAVRKAVPANTSDADGDYEFLQMANGRLYTMATVDKLTLDPGTKDIFGAIRTAGQNNQVDIQFYREVPSSLVTVSITNGGTATSSVGGALFASGTNTSGGIKGVSFGNVEYHGGSEIYAYFTATFTPGVASSYMRIGIYDTNNGAFIGYEGTSFGITTRNNAVDTTVAKASWNADVLTGASGSKFTRAGVAEAIDLTKINVFRIRYGWVGGAPISFEVLSPDGDWVVFHQVKAPNNLTGPTFRNADLPMTLDILKTSAGATDLQILTGCWAAGTTYQISDKTIIGQGSQTALNNNIVLDTAGTGSTDCFNYRSIHLQIIPASGTVTAGAITFEGSNDNTNFVAVSLYDASSVNTMPVSTYTLVASTNRYFSGPLYFRYFRARISTGVTGTTTGVQCFSHLRTTTFEPQAPVFAKAEDVASADADVGIPAMARRTATPANTSGTDGDYEMLQMANGSLWVAPLGFFVTVSTDITRPADTTAYATNDALSDSTSAPTSGGFTFTSAARKSGGSGVITDAIITTSNDAGTLLQGEIWLFNQAVTNVNDNAAFAVSDAEIKTCVGKIPFTLEDAGNNGFYHAQNLNIGFTCSGSANLRYLIRVKNAYTPASAEVLTCVLKIMQVD